MFTVWSIKTARDNKASHSVRCQCPTCAPMHYEERVILHTEAWMTEQFEGQSQTRNFYGVRDPKTGTVAMVDETQIDANPIAETNVEIDKIELKLDRDHDKRNTSAIVIT